MGRTFGRPVHVAVICAGQNTDAKEIRNADRTRKSAFYDFL